MPDHDRGARRGTRRVRLLLILLALPLALAAQPARAADADDMRIVAAQELDRLMLLDLGLRSSLSVESYRIAHTLLSIAQERDPGDLERAHLIVEAAWGAADDRLLREASERVVRLDPADTVAQLRLITASIGRAQTAEDRLSALERFLGPEGERLDPAVRSRLALDAALLSRELGDEAGYLRNLTAATALDITNKEAAALALTYHAERVDDPVGQLELLVNMLYADPTDSNLHASIAELLARYGAYPEARRFFDNAFVIHARAGDINIALSQRSLSLQLAHEGPEPVVKALNDSVASRINGIDVQRAMRDVLGIPTIDLPENEQLELGPELERIRLLAAAAAGDQESLDASAQNLAAKTEERLEVLEPELTATDPAALTWYQNATVTSAMLLHESLLLVGAQGPEPQRDFAALNARFPSLAGRFDPLVPWIDLRTGELDRAGARRALIPEGLTREIFDAELALERGDRADAARGFLRAIRTSPISPLGGWAAHRLRGLIGREDLSDSTGRALAVFAGSVPPRIDQMTRDPSDWMRLDAEVIGTSLGAGEPARLRITLQNLAPIPLAVGDGRPIATRMLVQPVIKDDLGPSAVLIQPWVVELDRRLRLEPFERLTVEVRADAPYTDWATSVFPRTNLRPRWRVLQSFTTDSQTGAYAHGSLALSAETTEAVLKRRPIDPTTTFQSVIERIQNGDDRDLRADVVAARAMLLATRYAIEDKSLEAERDLVVRDLASAMTQRFLRSSDDARVVMLCLLPHQRVVPGMVSFDRAVRAHAQDEIASATDPDHAVIAATLLTRVASREDPLLTRVATSPSLGDLSDMARLLGIRAGRGIIGIGAITEPTLELAGPSRKALQIRRAASEQSP